MELARADGRGGSILYDPRLIELPTDGDFEPGLLAAAGRVRGHAPGRGQTWFLSARDAAGAGSAGPGWVLRHYRRGGLVARVSADRYVYTGASRTRGFAELRVLAELRRRGLAVPAPVAARYERVGPTYRADLITVEIEGARTLATLCVGGVPEPVDAGLARSVGGAIRAIHDAGVFHADLNAHNILVDRSGRVWVIDFDRARFRRPGPWTRDNLARLKRSIDKVHRLAGRETPPALWAGIESGYAGGV